MWRSRARSAARGVTSAFSLMRKAAPMLTPRTSFSVISGLSVRSAIGEPMIPDDNGSVFRDLPWKTIAAAAGILTIAIGFAYHVAGHPMDFRVYHYGARGVFDGTRPVYGPASGIGWPMHYRYPPLFLLVFAPFAAMPLAWAAGLWVVLKVFVSVALVRSIVERTGAGTPLLGKGGVAAPSSKWPLPLKGAAGMVRLTSDNRWLNEPPRLRP